MDWKRYTASVLGGLTTLYLWYVVIEPRLKARQAKATAKDAESDWWQVWE